MEPDPPKIILRTGNCSCCHIHTNVLYRCVSAFCAKDVCSHCISAGSCEISPYGISFALCKGCNSDIFSFLGYNITNLVNQNKSSQNKINNF